MQKIQKIIFLGTPALAVPFLKKCAKNFEIAGVVTAPDKPVGRKQILTPSPVATAAEELNLPLFKPAKVSDPSFLPSLKKLNADIAVVVAYGEILSKDFLNLFPFGAVNVHFSLLPRWRGASPVQHAILSGDEKTGVTIQQMVYELDSGDILATAETPIQNTDTTATLFEKLSALGSSLLIDTLSTELKPAPQDHTKATFCTKIKKQDGELDFSLPAKKIDQLRRAYTPWPGVYTFFKGERLKILDTAVQEIANTPGGVFEKEGKILIGTGEGSLEILTLQKSGKSATDAQTFVRGYPDFLNTKLPN